MVVGIFSVKSSHWMQQWPEFQHTSALYEFFLICIAILLQIERGTRFQSNVMLVVGLSFLFLSFSSPHPFPRGVLSLFLVKSYLRIAHFYPIPLAWPIWTLQSNSSSCPTDLVLNLLLFIMLLFGGSYVAWGTGINLFWSKAFLGTNNYWYTPKSGCVQDTPILLFHK